MVANQHTEATRKKLREAAFFLQLLATVSKPLPMAPEAEVPEFYLSAFLSAARAVPWALQKERKADWDAWLNRWRAGLSASDVKLWGFLVDQRNKVHKEGGPELTFTLTPASLFEFMRDIQLHGGNVFVHGRVPGTPPPTVTALVKSFTAHPGRTLAEACQPLFDLMRRLVDEFERDHPPSENQL